MPGVKSSGCHLWWILGPSVTRKTKNKVFHELEPDVLISKSPLITPWSNFSSVFINICNVKIKSISLLTLEWEVDFGVFPAVINQSRSVWMEGTEQGLFSQRYLKLLWFVVKSAALQVGAGLQPTITAQPKLFYLSLFSPWSLENEQLKGKKWGVCSANKSQVKQRLTIVLPVLQD